MEVQTDIPASVSSAMIPFEFPSGPRVIFGDGKLEQLGELAREFDARHVLVVADPGIVHAGIVERARETLQTAKLTVHVFSAVEENPSTQHVAAGAQLAREEGPIDLIIGLGGGSAMDCAKGINFLLTNGGRMEDYWGRNKATLPMLPSIGIPTTAGTGSEAQSYALITQEATHRKMACGDRKALFRIVILDPSLLETIPRPVAAASGIDAVSHAVESYVTSCRNPVSQMFAAEAWRLLESGFEGFLDQPGNREFAGHVLLGAHLAGAAIEQSMLGAAHACANPLTARFGIRHGMAVALTLTQVIRWNAEVVEDLYCQLSGMISGSPKNSSGSVAQLVERITEMKAAAGVPARMRDCGVTAGDLEDLADEAAEQWTGQYNPRSAGKRELLQLYESAY